MKTVICVNINGCENLTVGQKYTVIEKRAARGYIYVRNDAGQVRAYQSARFIDVP